ncbi:MAG TPA: acyl-CoA synthetase [Aestuariivirgaceae bacterium]|nr:acyl-CoA synthetase [Aestuariivirgaceae bacterium]
MLHSAQDYAALTRTFAWSIPRRFNIGNAACERWAAAEPDRTAIIHVHPDGRADRVTYGALNRMANRIANILQDCGVGRGDRVALVLPQAPETAAAHIAIYKLGAVAVPLSLLFGVEALQYRLADAGAAALVMTDAVEARLAEIRAQLPDLRHVFSTGPAAAGVRSLAETMELASDRFIAADTGPDDPAIMIYTSGTTGQPKGALHGHRVLLGHLPGVQFAHEFLPQPGDVLWTPADWAWIGGLINVLLPGLYLGVPVVARRFDKFDPDQAFALMAGHGVRNVFLPPTALRMMQAEPPGRWHNAISLRSLFSGGETVGRGLQEWSQGAFGLAINEVYGQTECNLVVESCAGLGVLRPGSMGKPVPGHIVAILDADGAQLGDGEVGTIAVRRPDPVMFLGYWNREDATRAKFVGDWLITGDQGLRDGDGYFHFVGRDDDVITSAGYRIGPGEVEDCLSGHPAVKLAAVVGKPDALRTEIVKAFIVLNQGFEPSEALAGEIKSYVRTRLAAHEYPREIAFIDELPLTTTGKVIRRLLR